MLRVDARKAPSRIHGVGLFAFEFIPAGFVIWEFTPGFDVSLWPFELERLSVPARIQVEQYAFFACSKKTVGENGFG